MFDNYRLLHPNKESSIGRDNFLKVSKMLCEKGEIKTGLSSYFVRVFYVGFVLKRMMKIRSEFQNIVDMNGKSVGQISEELFEEWKKPINSFLINMLHITYKYL